MKKYRKVLLAVDLDSASQAYLIKTAKEFAGVSGADLYLTHAVEQISSYGAAYGVATGVEVEETLFEYAKRTMEKLAEKLNISKERIIVEIGPPKAVILENAEKLKADLVIVGSHGRHGIRLLLGSTANAVLHGAKCDVLAVRIKD